MLERHGISVCVSSQGSVLRELAVETQGPTVTCFIESVEAASFQVDYSVSSAVAEELTVKTAVDGVDHDYTLDRASERDGRVHHVEGRLERGGTLRPFCFAVLRQLDDDEMDDSADYERRENVLSSLGTIEVVFRRCTYGGRVEGEVDRSEYTPLSSIRERDIRLGDYVSHMAGLSPPKRVKKVSLHTVNELDTLQAPFARFVLKYRSRSNLESLGILPPSASDTLFFEQASRRLNYLRMNGDISEDDFEKASSNLSSMGIDDLVWT